MNKAVTETASHSKSVGTASGSVSGTRVSIDVSDITWRKGCKKMNS